MKILDRYIWGSITASFLFGVAMFMALLMAMQLLPELIELIADQGVPVGKALLILALQLPGLLVYAFPMSILLCILLVFNRMSADSEMVAIRAGGISFVRIVVPALLFSLVITGLTYYISDDFNSTARQLSNKLRQEALHSVNTQQAITIEHEQDNGDSYTIRTGKIDARINQMDDVEITFRTKAEPIAFIHAKHGSWTPETGKWTFSGNMAITIVASDKPHYTLTPTGENSELSVQSFAMQIKETPSDIAAVRDKPEDMSADQLRTRITRLTAIGGNVLNLHKTQMELARRYAVPFSCLIFALIGAPLGLRNHRTSSAVGLGVSLLLIIIYYFIAHFLNMLGKSGDLDPTAAAWLPNILGAVAGVIMIARQNQ